ncbi:hypothetical protein FZW96_13920 [Bacillus sp. BGMRC 2118]|nr:hypothetical protein FZW96_13920 [Bacillus sp. BGMRC 2118]
MDTLLLFYKIYEQDVQSEDYVDWAVYMLGNDFTSFSLTILSSLSAPLNIFEVEDYFTKAFKELAMNKPSYDKCANYYIQFLAKQILENKGSLFEYVDEIIKTVRNLDFPKHLEEWFHISEKLDDLLYGDNYFSVTKETLMESVIDVATRQLKEMLKEQ